MTMELKLDTNALMTLFPEGSEARVKLTQAVLAETSKRVLGRLAEPQLAAIAKTSVDSMRKVATQELSAKYVNIVDTGYATNVTLKPELIAHIKATITSSVGEVIRDGVSVALEGSAEKIKAQMDSTLGWSVRAEISKLVKQEMAGVESLVKAKVAEVVNSLLTKQ